MPFVPAPGVAQINQLFQTNGGRAENVYHVHKDSGDAWTLTELANMLTVFNTWEQATGRVQRASDVVCLSILGRDLTTQNGTETSVPGTSSGVWAGNSAPDNVTIAIKKNTGLSGRSFRGRTYWVGVPISQVSKDALLGAYVTALISALNTLHDNVNAITGFHLCLLRSQYNGTKLNPRQEAPISSFSTIDITIDSQRRRLLGRGM